MNTTPTQQKKLLEEVLREVRGIRRDIDLFLPTEDLRDYAHPERILASLKAAQKQYPPKRQRP